MISKRNFLKTPEGETASLYKIDNGCMQVEISDFGGVIYSITMPDANGVMVDICPGHRNGEDYIKNPGSFGATIGRFANRIKNGTFSLDGKEYEVTKNSGENHLHGGQRGFGKRLWDAETIGDNALKLNIASPDGDEGYPGNLTTTVLFTLTDDNRLVLNYTAQSDKRTIINLTNHAYFNLGGHACGTCLDNMLKINASQFLETDETGCAIGLPKPVAGTVFDFTSFKAIGRDIEQGDEQLKLGQGYDHCYIPDGKGFRHIASAYHPVSLISMDIWTDMPGVQLYSGNMMGALPGKNGAKYHKRDGFCLETQFFPNSPNCPEYPSCVIEAGELFQTVTSHNFGLKK